MFFVFASPAGSNADGSMDGSMVVDANAASSLAMEVDDEGRFGKSWYSFLWGT